MGQKVFEETMAENFLKWLKRYQITYSGSPINLMEKKQKENPPSFVRPFFFFLNFIYLFIYGCVGSSFLCEGFLSSCGKWGPLFIAVHGPLTITASPVVEHRLQMRRLSNCGSRAQLLRGMWDLPTPGIEPVSPALAGRFSTTAPPGKPSLDF